MKDDVSFRVRRVWVKGSDLPTPGDYESNKAFVLRIKSGDFPEAVKKTWDTSAYWAEIIPSSLLPEQYIRKYSKLIFDYQSIAW